jgi:RNA polymerase sigma-70 factor (ECF subfamily)
MTSSEPPSSANNLPGENASPLESSRHEDASSASIEKSIEEYRSYLHVLAQTQLQGKLRAKADVSDIVQQTMLQAHQARTQFRGHTSGEKAAWLRQILANVLASTARHYQRSKRAISREQSIAALEQSSLQLANLLVADGSSPSQGLRRDEDGQRIATAMLKLPDDQRSAILLKYWNDLSLKEIGQQLDRSPEATAGLLYRALKTLRKSIRDEPT